MIADPIPAATVIPMRDGAACAAPPDILMIERGAALAFLGGAMVFPGGRVDPGDVSMVPEDADDADDIAARIAAIRETIEEVGLALGLSPRPDDTAVATLRLAMTAGTPFAEALAGHGLALDLAALTPFARWCPEHVPVRRFDARFYLAEVPRGASAPIVDGGETADARWRTAQAWLAAADRGEVLIILPTRRTLERLAQFRDIASARADARAWPIRRIIPFQAERDGVPSICIPDDLGYPITAEPLATARRG